MCIRDSNLNTRPPIEIEEEMNKVRENARKHFACARDPARLNVNARKELCARRQLIQENSPPKCSMWESRLIQENSPPKLRFNVACGKVG